MNDSKQAGILLSELDKTLFDIVTGSITVRDSELPVSKYRGLLEAAPDAMVVVKQNGEIIRLNVAAEK
jgi:PAS domain-containing protein